MTQKLGDGEGTVSKRLWIRRGYGQQTFRIGEGALANHRYSGSHTLVERLGFDFGWYQQFNSCGDRAPFLTNKPQQYTIYNIEDSLQLYK